MIYDQTKNLSRYAGVHPRFAKAFAFFEELMAKNAENGCHVLEGTEIEKEIYVNICGGENQPKDSVRAEAHKRYIDVQILLEGDEDMFVPSHTPALTTEYQEDGDYMLYENVPLDACHRLTVTEGSFAIFLAEEMHAPGHSSENRPTKIRKAIIKILA
jgi:YhcH/YjgK/YiaL family protein